jgi:hypothetical protein
MTDYEMLFSPGGLVPVNVETTGWLVREVLKLRAAIAKTLEFYDALDAPHHPGEAALLDELATAVLTKDHNTK